MAVDAEAARTIGMRVWQIRDSRGKSLRAVAELAGMNHTTLWRIENGERALSSRAEVSALAEALQIAPSELTSLPIPAPGDGLTDSTIEAVRRALMAVNHRHFHGKVLPVGTLRERVGNMLVAVSIGDQETAGSLLPGLVSDLHASIVVGRDTAELLELAVLLHTQGTIAWLRTAGASVDLREQVSTLARRLAEERDDSTALGLAVAGSVRVMMSSGAFDLALAELNSVSVPTDSPESMQLAGMLALYRAEVAAADSRSGDVEPGLEYAGELAERTGERNAYMLGFGPTNTEIARVSIALDLHDYDTAVGTAERIHPEQHANQSRRAAYWAYYGRALARLKPRRDDAIKALRQAELIVPHRVLRDPFVREMIAELLPRTRRNSPAGQELRGMADRAGILPPL